MSRGGADRGGRGRTWRLIGLALLVCLTGCAYFNTFYFARKYYSQAERLREESASEKLPPEAIRKYESAILQCKKVLNFHAGSGWVDDAVFLMGASYYGKADYDSALHTFDELLRKFPESNFVPRSHYLRGLCFHERRRYDEMREAFEAALAAGDSDFEAAGDIIFTLARSAEDQEDYAGAIQEYRRLIRTYPESERSEDALLEIGRLYFDDARYDSSLIAYEELVRETKDEERYRRGQIALAESLIRLGRSDEAIALLERHVPRNEDTASRRDDDWPARVRLVLAQAHNNLDEHERALEHYEEVIEHYRTSPYAVEAQYQIGYTYESYMDSLASAESAYERASRMSSGSSFRDLARDRLASVKKLRTLSSETVESEDTDEGAERAAEAALKIAELYLFTERKVDEAMDQYVSVEEEWPETESAPKAAYAIGWIELREREERENAWETFRRLVEAYPASEQARSAIDLLVAEEADTTGLRALLVTAQPDTARVAEDGEAAVGDAPADSLMGPPVERPIPPEPEGPPEGPLPAGDPTAPPEGPPVPEDPVAGPLLEGSPAEDEEEPALRRIDPETARSERPPARSPGSADTLRTRERTP